MKFFIYMRSHVTFTYDSIPGESFTAKVFERFSFIFARSIVVARFVEAFLDIYKTRHFSIEGILSFLLSTLKTILLGK